MMYYVMKVCTSNLCEIRDIPEYDAVSAWWFSNCYSQHIISGSSVILMMLRLTLSSLSRPLAGPRVTLGTPGLSRNFSSLRSTFNSVPKRPTSSSNFWSRCSRTFMTDSAAVVARPTQQEAWRKYGITAVRFL
jgi:hypothetical protein